MNKFAIILPTIGRETLKEAVDSVLAQGYKDWNLIIAYDVDYAYKNMLEEGWMSNDCRIINICKGNEWISHDSGADARNYAMGYVPSDCNWVCHLDDDDTFHTNRLGVFNNFINNSLVELDLFYSYGDLYKSKRNGPRSSKKELRRVGTIDNVTCGGMCYRPEIFHKTKGWNPLNVQDHDRELYEEMKRHTHNHDVLRHPTFNFNWRS